MPAKTHVMHGRDHRSRGADPIPASPWIDPALTSPWVDANPSCPFMYRWGPFGDTVDEAGLEFTGQVTGGTTGSAVMTFPVADRFDCDKDFLVDMKDAAGTAMVGAAHIASSTGVMTLTFPVGVSGSYVAGIEASENSVDQTAAPRGRFNFVAGQNIVLDVVDDPANSQVNIVISLVKTNSYGSVNASFATYTAAKAAYPTYTAMKGGLLP